MISLSKVTKIYGEGRATRVRALHEIGVLFLAETERLEVLRDPSFREDAEHHLLAENRRYG